MLPEGIERPLPAMVRSDKKQVYDFANGKRCPGCKGTDTVAVSTQGNVQYRSCRYALCEYSHKHYSVVGKEIL